MSKSKNVTFHKRRPLSRPLGAFFKPKDVPIASALRNLWLSMYEMEMLKRSVLAERNVQVAIVMANKDGYKSGFKKAQKAAVETDRLTALAKKLNDVQSSLFDDVTKIWTKYSGSPVEGQIVALWLCRNLSVDEICSTLSIYRKTAVDALYKLRYVFIMLGRCANEVDSNYKDKVIRLWEKEWNEMK